MTRTQIANLALDLLGEPPLLDFGSDRTTTADLLRLHFDHALETLLEEHHWDFGTARATLTPNDDRTASTALLDPAGANNSILLTATTLGLAGNNLSAEIVIGPFLSPTATTDRLTLYTGDKHRMIVSGDLTFDDAPLVFPPLFYAGRFLEVVDVWTDTGAFPNGTGTEYFATGQLGACAITKQIDGISAGEFLSFDLVASPDLVTTWIPAGIETGTPTVTAAAATAAQAIAAINAAGLPATAANGPSSTGSGTLAAVALTSFTGGQDTILPDWSTSFDLPADCLRVLKLNGTDPDQPRTKFKILGRKILLPIWDKLTEPLVIEYITDDDSTWSATFRDAFIHFLASKLAPRITGSPNMATDLFQKAQLALGKAVTKDARESLSAENHGPRNLIARSSLVRSRLRHAGLTDYEPDAP